MQSTEAVPVRMPDGESATFEEMQAFGETLQQFIRAQEAALADVQDTQRHNDIIDYLQLLADSYNEQLRVFKAAENRRQHVLLLSVIHFVDD